MRIVKFVGITILVVPVVSLSVYWFVCFQPYVHELRKLSLNGTETIKHDHDRIYRTAVAADGEKGIRIWSIRSAYYNLSFKDYGKSKLNWHLDNLLWYFGSYLYFNEQQVFGIWIECAFNECTNDIENASRRYFGLELSKLSDDQLAELVGSVKAPKIFIPGSERAKERAKIILFKSDST
tara:strand:+ start:13136 stop:13675 length:540 start_codon:yes stop_codon:yes gene_type:complete